MNKKICRLCLQTVSENCQEIGESLKDIFKLNLDISKDAVMCIECRNNLQVYFNLKSACVDVKERTISLTDVKNNVNLYPVNTVNTNQKLFTEPKDDIRCNFCTKSTGKEGLTSLHESKENMFLVDRLEKYIPELNLSNCGELSTCETCLDRMQGVSIFLTKCLDIEEKISKYIEIEGTDDKGQIELQNVQQFIFKSTLKFDVESYLKNELRQTYDCVKEEFPLKSECEISDEIEVDNLESLIKTEEVDIKSEHSDCDRYQEPSANIKLDNNHKKSLKVTMYKCGTCAYETRHMGRFNQHKLFHQRRTEMKMFKCEVCEFETEHKSKLKKHMSIHKKPSMFKCDKCTYETTRSYNLKQHEVVHKSFTDIEMFKCAMCTYETKYGRSLKRHISIHKNTTTPSKVTMYKCDTCTYETKHSGHFNYHTLLHKSRLEVKTFK